jgi:hypothetical protein
MEKNNFCKCALMRNSRVNGSLWGDLIERSATENYLKHRVIQLKRKIALKDAEITNLQYQLEQQTKYE